MGSMYQSPADEGSDGRERKAEEAAGRGNARQRNVEDLKAKNGDARCEAAGCCLPLLAIRVSQRRACSAIGADRTRYAIAAGVLVTGLFGQGQRSGGDLVSSSASFDGEGLKINHKKVRRLYTRGRL